MAKLNSFEDIVAWQKARELNYKFGEFIFERLWTKRPNVKSQHFNFFKYCGRI